MKQSQHNWKHCLWLFTLILPFLHSYSHICRYSMRTDLSETFSRCYTVFTLLKVSDLCTIWAHTFFSHDLPVCKIMRNKLSWVCTNVLLLMYFVIHSFIHFQHCFFSIWSSYVCFSVFPCFSELHNNSSCTYSVILFSNDCKNNTNGSSHTAKQQD